MKKLYTFLGLAAISVATYAQTPTHTVTGPRTFFNIPAAGPNFTFFNLESGKEVAASDSATDKWHVAFCKTKMIFNSGKGGPGAVTAQLIGTDFMATDVLPASGYKNEDTEALIVPTGSGNGWYNYNTSNNLITAIPNRSVAVKFGNSYALLQVIDYYLDQDASKASATYSIRFQLSATTDVSQKYTKIMNLYSGYPTKQLFNLASADTLAPADSSTTKWHLGFASTTINVNTGTSGPGTTEAQIVDSKFNDILIAPEAGYRKDEAGNPAIPTGSGNGWYTYDIVVHSITPNANRTILVKDGIGHYAKVAVKSYYKDAPANPTFLDASTTKFYTMEYFFNPIKTRNIDPNGTTTGIFATESDAAAFNVYPNPANGSTVSIQYPEELAGNEVSILDANGKLVYSTSLDHAAEISLPVETLTPGLYFINLAGKTQKLIIQ